MKIKSPLFIWLIPLAICLCLVSQAVADEVPYPNPRGYVNDFANLLNSSDKRKVEALGYQLQQKTTAQIAVVTLGSTKPLEIEDYAVRLFEKWGIGQKGKDNGVLLLVAVNDRKVRIETGYGLEGALPDAICNQIIQQHIIPYFKQGKFSEGVTISSFAIVQLVAKEYNAELSDIVGEEHIPAGLKPVHPLIALLQVLFYLVMMIMFLGLRLGLFGFLLMGSGRRRGGYWHGGGYGGSSGGFGGGFGGFGGGFSGGGGASGGW